MLFLLNDFVIRHSFLIMADLINVMRHCCSTELFAFEAIFVSTRFLKVFELFGFSICSYLVDEVERGRNLMCEGTLPSPLVENIMRKGLNRN